MSVLGIIPAAGRGSRWGGYFKELLPTGDKEWLLDRTIHSMKKAGASKICIVTSPEKITTHVTHIKKQHDGIFYVIQKGEDDIWSAVIEALPFSEDYNLFAMPDTYFPLDAFSNTLFDTHIDFYLGVFTTKTPERFGVLIDDHIEDKSSTLPGETSYTAWGTLLWTRRVAEFWMEQSTKSYTDAINEAMDEFRWGTFQMEFYRDMAKWEDYASFIEGEGKTS